ncbi:MAG: hypothetical protein AB1757_01105 [Acidobacteriota bacterium]
MSEFDEYPVDRLRFEYERRQNEVSNLQQELSDLKREESQTLVNWERARDATYLRRMSDVDQEFRVKLHEIESKTERVKQRMNILRTEMEAIVQVLNVKWK